MSDRTTGMQPQDKPGIPETVDYPVYPEESCYRDPTKSYLSHTWRLSHLNATPSSQSTSYACQAYSSDVMKWLSCKICPPNSWTNLWVVRHTIQRVFSILLVCLVQMQTGWILLHGLGCPRGAAAPEAEAAAGSSTGQDTMQVVESTGISFTSCLLGAFDSTFCLVLSGGFCFRRRKQKVAHATLHFFLLLDFLAELEAAL